MDGEMGSDLARKLILDWMQLSDHRLAFVGGLILMVHYISFVNFQNK